MCLDDMQMSLNGMQMSMNKTSIKKLLKPFKFPFKFTYFDSNFPIFITFNLFTNPIL